MVEVSRRGFLKGVGAVGTQTAMPSASPLIANVLTAAQSLHIDMEFLKYFSSQLEDTYFNSLKVWRRLLHNAMQGNSVTTEVGYDNILGHMLDVCYPLLYVLKCKDIDGAIDLLHAQSDSNDQILSFKDPVFVRQLIDHHVNDALSRLHIVEDKLHSNPQTRKDRVLETNYYSAVINSCEYFRLLPAGRFIQQGTGSTAYAKIKLSKEDLYFEIESAFMDLHGFQAKILPLKPTFRSLLDLVEGHPLMKINRIVDMAFDGAEMKDFIRKGFNHIDINLPPMPINVRSEIRTFLKNYEKAFGWHSPPVMDRAFLERTVNMPLDAIFEELRIIHATQRMPYEKISENEIEFHPLFLNPAQGTMEVYHHHGEMARWAVTYKTEHAGAYLPKNLCLIFSNAIRLEVFDDATYVVASHHATDEDLRFIDARTVPAGP